MKNIHLIPTDKPSRILFDKEENRLLPLQDSTVFMQYQDLVENQHIYITNDEEIKVGDWFYVKTPNIYGGNVAAKCLGFGENCWSEHILTDVADEKGYHPSHCVKIILTTDQDLIKDGVQSIDDEFLEWFVKNSSCERVEIRYTVDFNSKAVIIIPKEEPKHISIIEKMKPLQEKWQKDMDESLKPKQETLEEFTKESFKSRLEEHLSVDYNDGVKLGAKWQQERIDNDMIEFSWWLIKNLGKYSDDYIAHFKGEYLKQWKQLKNK